MGPFEFVFSLFGLLLGLSLAEVLGGFGRALKRQRLSAIGWLTPLLGLVVCVDLISFWSMAWFVREHVPVRFSSLVTGFLITGVYYLAATLVFPEEAGDRADLDDHYLTVRRRVLGAVLFCNIITYTIIALLLRSLPLNIVITFVFWLAAIGAAMLVRSRRPSMAMLIILLLLYLYAFVEEVLGWV